MSSAIFRATTWALVAGLGSAALLAGCASPAEVAAADRQTCAGYGFAPGTDAFANCMMQADARRQKAAADWQRDQQKKWDAQTAAPTATATPAKENCHTVEGTVSAGDPTAPGGATTQTHSSTVCSSF